MGNLKRKVGKKIKIERKTDNLKQEEWLRNLLLYVFASFFGPDPAQRSIDYSRKYHNIPKYSLLVTPKFCISNVFSFSWGLFNSQEELKTMLMQTFEVTNKEYYGMLLFSHNL